MLNLLWVSGQCVFCLLFLLCCFNGIKIAQKIVKLFVSQIKFKFSHWMLQCIEGQLRVFFLSDIILWFMKGERDQQIPTNEQVVLKNSEFLWDLRMGIKSSLRRRTRRQIRMLWSWERLRQRRRRCRALRRQSRRCLFSFFHFVFGSWSRAGSEAGAL